jgi:hypothetical protein
LKRSLFSETLSNLNKRFLEKIHLFVQAPCINDLRGGD